MDLMQWYNKFYILFHFNLSSVNRRVYWPLGMLGVNIECSSYLSIIWWEVRTSKDLEKFHSEWLGLKPYQSEKWELFSEISSHFSGGLPISYVLVPEGGIMFIMMEIKKIKWEGRSYFEKKFSLLTPIEAD